jgi:tetratricopeptide (TPR) repeat protein
MKSKKVKASVAPVERPAARGRSIWVVGLGAVLLLLSVFEVYRPSMQSPFVFDDLYLPFMAPNAPDVPLKEYLLSPRPLTNLSYWFNFHAAGQMPEAYHQTNVFLHYLAGLALAGVIFQLLGRVQVETTRRWILTVFGTGLFLLHPAHAESVAYVTSRSENLATLFYCGAFALFLRFAGTGITWARAFGVTALFGAAALSKEYAVTLPALMLLTDYFFHPGFRLDGIKRHWRLYGILGAGAALAGVGVLYVLSRTTSVGAKAGIAWYEYLFTQFRAIWWYFSAFFLPFGFNVDHDFPVSRNIADHGALIGMVALGAGLFLAWKYRREYPLASFGFVAFLLLLAPTSSVVPIQDVLVERRMYLPALGLILMVLEVVRRAPFGRMAISSALAGVLFICAAMTYQRNQVWSGPVALWQDSVATAPKKMRPRFQLAYALYQENRCVEAAREYRVAMTLPNPEQALYVDASLAFDCAGNPDEAIAALQKALEFKRDVHVLATMGTIEGRRGRNEEALKYLNEALRLDPQSEMALSIRGNVYFQAGNLEQARRDYRGALSINPQNEQAIAGLAAVDRQLAAQQP